MIWKFLPSFFFVFCALLGGRQAKCQPSQPDLKFRRFSTENGLSENSVFSIVQDSFGNIWVGTLNGLNKFDGNKNTVYRYDPTDAYSIPGNFIRTIYIDPNGVTWIGTYGQGLCVFEPKFNRFYSLPDINGRPVLSDDRVHSICKDWNGNLWVGTERGLNRIRLEKGVMEIDYFFNDSGKENSLSHNYIRKVFEDQSNRLWIGTHGGGVNLFDSTVEDGFIRFVHDSSPSSISSNKIRDIFQSSDGTIWIGTDGGGLNRVVEGGNGEITFESFRHDPLDETTLSDDRVFQIAEGSGKSLWLATNGGGLCRFDTKTKVFQKYTGNRSLRSALSENTVWSIFIDRAGFGWAGTRRQGLNIFRPENPKFHRITSYSPKPYQLSHDHIWQLFTADNGNIYIGTKGAGIDILDPQTMKIDHIAVDPTEACSLRRGEVYAFYQDSSGRMWIGMGAGGVQTLDPNSRCLSRPKLDYVAFPDLEEATILAMAPGNNSCFFLCSNSYKLLRINPWSGKIFQIDLTQDKELLEKLLLIIDLEMDNYGTLWAATEYGIFSIDSATVCEGNCKVRRYSGLSRKKGVNPFYVNCLNPMLNGKGILVGKANGVDALTFPLSAAEAGISGGTGANYAPKQRWLQGENISSMELTDQYAWCATFSGVYRVNFLSTNRSIQSFQTPLVRENQFMTNSSCIGPYGRIYFGGFDGITYFQPDSISVDSFVPTVKILGIDILGSPISNDQEMNFLDSLKLNYWENTISIHFGATESFYLDGFQYQYRLLGQNDKWTKPSTISAVTYHNLRPGLYEFQVRGINSDGISSQQLRRFYLSISIPWWTTLWFKTGSVLVIILALVSVFTVRFRAVRNREKQKRKLQTEINRLEKAALSAQMNPHFVYNSLNSINRFILGSDVATASRYLSRFSKLMRKVLEHSRRDFISLAEEMQGLRLYVDLEKLRMGDRLEVQVELADKIEPESIYLPPMLIQPFIENAIWHGIAPKDGKGEILISYSLSQDEQYLVCIIEDDGIGRKAADALQGDRENTAQGVSITSQRLMLFSQTASEPEPVLTEDLHDGSGAACGTRVTIRIPM